MKEEKLVTNKQLHQLMHEVKNPLAICKGYLEIIKQNEGDISKKYLEIIDEEITRSISILASYFTLEKEIIDINLLLEDIIELLNPYFKKNNSEIILLKNNKELYINGDYNHLKQVIINILKNSFESKENNKLIIIIKVKEKNNKYNIEIIDNGKGMNKYILNNIMSDYYTTKSNGMGLGLSYIKDNLKIHGGSVKYYSKEKLGTKVILSIPKKSPKTFNNNNYCWSK